MDTIGEDRCSTSVQVPPASHPRRRHPNSDSAETYSRPAKRTCQYCLKKEEDDRQMRRCAACKVDLYCDRACQKAAWPEHKHFCRINLNTQAFHASIPGSVERSDALRAFIDKHRASMGAAAFQAVYRYYLPPLSSDPAATALEREDMLIIDLRTRPNAHRARPEKRFYVVDAWLDTVSSFFSRDAVEVMRGKLRHGSQLATTNKGSPSGTVLITLMLSDSDAGPMPPNIVPFAFPVVGNLDMDVFTLPWKPRLICMLNEGIVQ